jgi:hypothetical protein
MVRRAGLHGYDNREHFAFADRRSYERMPVLALGRWDYGNGLDDTTEGYGFRTPDGRTWSAPSCLWSTWHELGVLVIAVTGTRHHQPDLSDPSFAIGSPVRLYAEPNNPHDAKAIAVRNWTAEKTAGYVKRGSTSRLRNLLRGHDIRVMALSCRYDEEDAAVRRSLTVVIYRPDRLLGASDVPAHPPVA